MGAASRLLAADDGECVVKQQCAGEVAYHLVVVRFFDFHSGEVVGEVIVR